MKKSRRKFIRDSSLIGAGMALSNPAAMASVINRTTDKKDLIVYVFQRGAADGLHSIVPHGDPQYFNLRPQTAIADSIDLDGFFGLNPELSALKSIWDEGDLAMVHATGSPSDSRSHFDSQDNMEYANFDKVSARTGWLANYLAASSQEQDSVFRAIALNGAVQKSIKGPVEALTMTNLSSFDVITHDDLYEETQQTMQELFLGSDNFSQTSSVLFSAIEELKRLNPEDYPVENGAVYQNDDFAKKLKTLGVLVKADMGVEVATVDIGGWDNHDDILKNYSKPAQAFSKGLQAFYQDMGDRMENITVICVTEFGRRAAENGSKGTDHGHAGVIYAIGKQVNGGQVFADWPGLLEANLYRGDLQVTTDFREVLSELVVKRLKYSQDDLAAIIPDYTYNGGINLFK